MIKKYFLLKLSAYDGKLEIEILSVKQVFKSRHNIIHISNKKL